MPDACAKWGRCRVLRGRLRRARGAERDAPSAANGASETRARVVLAAHQGALRVHVSAPRSRGPRDPRYPDRMAKLLRLAHVVCLAPVALLACGARVEPRAPRGVAPGVAPPSAVAASDSAELPDASHLRALSAKIDGSCSDLCCVPKPEWLREHGEPPSAAVVRAAWNALEGSPEPAAATVALRIVSRAARAADVPRLVALVDDERPGVSLPSERPQQAPTRCVPVSWTRATPSSEARRALGRVFGTSFATAKDYRAWALAHPDPERSFEVWSARLSRQEPPPAELVDALRATDLDLYVRVMLARCHGDARCGGLARADPRGSGEVGTTYANLLRPAEALSTTPSLSAWPVRTDRLPGHARCAPWAASPERPEDLPPRHPRARRLRVRRRLRAARTSAPGCPDGPLFSFTRGSSSRASCAVHFGRGRFGCKGLGDVEDLTTRAAKGQSASAAAGENESATRRREALVAAMRACLKG